MAVDIMDPRAVPGWDRTLLESGDHSFFHSSGWAAVLIETYRYRPLYLTHFDKNGVSLVMPLMEVRTGTRGVALPFTDHCEPFSLEDGLLREARDRALAYGRAAGWRFIEWRGSGPVSDDTPAYETFLTHDISLGKSEDELFSEFKQANRRNIRKAVREEVSVSIDRSMDSLESFYRLNCVTRRRHGLPPQPLLFFRKVHEHILSKALGIVARAVHGGKTIAASVFFLFGTQAIFKYGASDHSHQDLRPNNLLMWEAIRWLQRNGITRLNLGRTEPENEGLLRFKRAWAGMEASVAYHRYGFKTEAFAAGRKKPYPRRFKLLSKAPLSMLRLVGRLAYRHIG